MMDEIVITDTDRAAARKAIIRQAIRAHGLTEQEFYGRGASRDLVEARRAAAAGLRRMGLSYPRIGVLLKRDHTTIMNYFEDRRSKKADAYSQRRLFRRLPTDICDAITAIAKAEEVTVETLIVQWARERAEYELAAKARAA